MIDGTTYDAEGKVDAITGVIDQSTGSVSMRAIFPNKEHMLRSGGTANVLIPYNMENVISYCRNPGQKVRLRSAAGQHGEIYRDRYIQPGQRKRISGNFRTEPRR